MSGASLKIKARDIGIDPDPTGIAKRYVKYGAGYTMGPNGKPGLKRLPLTRKYWAWPFYYALFGWLKAGRSARVWRGPQVWDDPARWTTVTEFQAKKAAWGWQWLQFFYDIAAARTPAIIPYQKDWGQGLGTDRGIIIKTQEGETYEFLNLRRPNPWEIAQINLRCAGDYYREGDLICDGMTRRDAKTPQAEGRGAGQFWKEDGTITWNMVKSGAITTAIAVTGFNIQYAAGARFRAPGTRVEHLTVEGRQTDAKVPFPPGDNEFAVPHASRFCLQITDAEIEAWLDRRNYAGPKRSTARIFAVAMRDYGWIILETCNYEPEIEMDGDINPAEGGTWWPELGLRTDQDFNDLLVDLITEDNIRLVKEAA